MLICVSYMFFARTIGQGSQNIVEEQEHILNINADFINLPVFNFLLKKPL